MQQQLTLARGHCLSFGSICLHAAAGANGLSTYIHLFMCYGSYNKLIWWQCVTAIDPPPPHVPHLVASHIQPAETAVQSGDPRTQTKRSHIPDMSGVAQIYRGGYENVNAHVQKRIPQLKIMKHVWTKQLGPAGKAGYENDGASGAIFN